MSRELRVGYLMDVRIRRFDKSNGSPARYETYQVRYTKYMRVMDVLEQLTYEQGVAVSYRAYCGAKRCGGCGVKMNGRLVLACWEAAEPGMTLEPMGNFPVISDLVVDMGRYEHVKRELHPVLVRRTDYSGFPEKLNHDEMLPSYKLMDCIECQLCTAACEVLQQQNFGGGAGTWSGYAGPAALVQLAKVSLDPRSVEDKVDLALVGRIQDCLSCNTCSTVCPNHIDVMRDAIDPLRERLIRRRKYYVRGWDLIRRLPPWFRRFVRCKLGLSLGEGTSV